MIINPYSLIKKNLSAYSLKIKEEHNEDVFKKFNEKTLHQKSGEKYNYYNNIIKGTEQAKDSLEDYYAQCVKFDKEASKQGYLDYINEKILSNTESWMGLKNILAESNANQSQIEALAQRREELMAQQEELQEQIQEIWSNALDSEDSGDSDTEPETTDRIEELSAALIDINAELDDNAEASESATTAQNGLVASISRVNSGFADYIRNNPNGTMMGYVRTLAAQKAAAFASAAAQAALNAALSMLTTMILQAVITGFITLAKHYDNMRDKNLEIANSFEETTNSIQEQTDKIRELQKVMEDEAATDNELYDARSQLLDIQKELIQTYGNQASAIDLVNGNLDKEIEKLNELERKEAAKALASMDEGSYKHDKKIVGTNSHALQIGSGHLYNTSTSTSANEYKKIAKQYEKILLDNGFTKSKQVDNNGYYRQPLKTPII